MLTVGMVSALALVGGHAALARAIWPGERVEAPSISPDPALRLRAATLEGITNTMKREAEGLRAKLGQAKARHAELEAEIAAGRTAMRDLEAERAVLRREVKRLHKAVVLAAAEGEDAGEDGGEDDGSSAPPAGPAFQ